MRTEAASLSLGVQALCAVGIPGQGRVGKVGVEEVLPEELSGLKVNG